MVNRNLRKMKKLQLIDLVRSFSILSVFAIHLDAILQKPQNLWACWAWNHFQRNGIYGVYLFFGVSGFLITGVIAKNSGSLFKPDLRAFYVQRAGRILPLLVLTIWIGICMLLIPYNPHADYMNVFHPEAGHIDFGFWVSVMTFTFNWFLAFHPPAAYGLYWNLLWSLSVEEQFYLLFPITLSKTENEKKLYSVLAGIISLGLFWRVGCYLWAPHNRFLQITTSFGAFDSIAIGVLLYLVDQRFGAWFTQDKKKAALICGVGLITMFGVYLFTDLGAFDQIYTPTLLGLGLALFLLGGLQLNFFESKFLKLFGLPGKYCYGGYLLHPLVLSVTFPILFQMSAWKGFGLFACVTTALAGISYHFFEMPANRMIRSSFMRKIY